MDEESKESEFSQKSLTDANQCMAIGVGVGGMGTVAALTLGATCPLCFFIAPALVGVGLIKRIKEKRKQSKIGLNSAPRNSRKSTSNI